MISLLKYERINHTQTELTKKEIVFFSDSFVLALKTTLTGAIQIL